MLGIANVGALAAVVMDTRLSRKEQQHDPDVSVVSKQQTFGFLCSCAGSSACPTGGSSKLLVFPGTDRWRVPPAAAASCLFSLEQIHGMSHRRQQQAMAAASGYRSLGTDHFL